MHSPMRLEKTKTGSWNEGQTMSSEMGYMRSGLGDSKKNGLIKMKNEYSLRKSG